MARITYTYEKITWPGTWRGKCRSCGKYVRRNRQFFQTQSPFNRDPETGLVKTKVQIQKEVREAARAWSESPPVCTACELSGAPASGASDE